MADIELVVKIPEEEYKIIKNHTGPMAWAERLIKNGTPLPKGHGDLMILSKDKLKENQIDLDFSCNKWISEVGLSNATLAIIEADEEVEENDKRRKDKRDISKSENNCV